MTDPLKKLSLPVPTPDKNEPLTGGSPDPAGGLFVEPGLTEGAIAAESDINRKCRFDKQGPA